MSFGRSSLSPLSCATTSCAGHHLHHNSCRQSGQDARDGCQDEQKGKTDSSSSYSLYGSIGLVNRATFGSGSPSRRPTFTIVSLTSIAENLRYLKSRVPDASGFIAVLKCNAYGHGLGPVALSLAKSRLVDAILVALVEEAIELRAMGVTMPILVAAGSFAGYYTHVRLHRLTPIIGNMEDLVCFARRARKHGDQQGIHVEIDVGMARLGFKSNEIQEVIDVLQDSDSIFVEGIMAHPSHANNPKAVGTERQLAEFEEVVTRFKRSLSLTKNRGVKIPSKSTQGSCSHILDPGAPLQCDTFATHFAPSGIASSISAELFAGQYLRVGLSIYGVNASSTSGDDIGRLKPALSWFTTVVALRTIATGDTVSYEGAWTAPRTTRIATIATGYADGYPRSLTNCGQVTILGKRANIVGHVCMDYTMVDVTDIADVRIGTDVGLIGDGVMGPTVVEVARWAGTIPWELLSRISSRVPQYHLGA